MTRRPETTTENGKDKDAAQVGRALRACLRDGKSIELEGLGTFLADAKQPIQFVPCRAPHVFIAYAIEDLALADRLYRDLAAAGFCPWLDRRKLLPGQVWTKCIERAIETSDFFIACFSTTSAAKRGQFPYEIRFALRCAERMPLDDVFVMPVRLNDCRVPRVISAQTQYLDMFPDWNEGIARLVNSIRGEMLARSSRIAA
jgi:hypothetical protein